MVYGCGLNESHIIQTREKQVKAVPIIRQNIEYHT